MEKTRELKSRKLVQVLDRTVPYKRTLTATRELYVLQGEVAAVKRGTVRKLEAKKVLGASLQLLVRLVGEHGVERLTSLLEDGSYENASKYYF